MKESKSARGFTLIEVLVVVSILAVLMGLVTVLVRKAGRSQMENETKQLVTAYLPLRIDSYMREFRRLPAMTVKELNNVDRWKNLQIDNVTNECIECLLVALRRPSFTQPIEEGDLPGEKPFGNTDNKDSWSQIPDGSPDAYAMEILDSWGNPVVYIHNAAYDKPVTMTNHLGDEVEVQALQKPDGTFYRPTKYQIISLGSNGVQDLENPEEDIMNFALQEEEGE
ncbi:MAG: type II secretion system protein [Planctomycetota bacterium]|jgi:prepilin-type N-terminal cleavage/methylation domain-containing protein